MATLLLVALLAAPAKGPTVIEDDFARAVAQARAKKKLLFVDAWAPWCHTCVFMREHVLNQPAFAAFEKDVVFAAVDTEKAQSAAFLDKYPVSFWPTLFFIDPKSETVVFKWIGSADATQMRGLLDAARRRDAAVKDADALLAEGKTEAAAASYVAHLDEARKDSAVRASLSMLSALSGARQHEACAKGAAEQAPTFTSASDRINALTWGLGCALELGPSVSERAALVTTLTEQSLKAVTLEGAMADDVSGLYELLVTERTSANDAPAAQTLAKAWLTFLEGAAEKAKTPQARAVFDPHRLIAAMSSKQVERVIPALEASERAMPTDFNPPARLALARQELGQLDQALADIGRALAKNQGGPRRVRLFDIQAGLYAAKKDIERQRQVLTEAIAYGHGLPASQRPVGRLTQLEAQLKALPPRR